MSTASETQISIKDSLGRPSAERTPGSNAQPRVGGTVEIYPLNPRTPAPSDPASQPSEVESRVRGGGRGARPWPAPPLACASARRARPACPRAHPSLARLARRRSSARARLRAGRGEAAAAGARPRTCQTREAGLERRALQARGPPRSFAAPGRDVRTGPAEPAGGGEMSGGPAAAPQVERCPLSEPRRPPPPGASELVGSVGPPIIYNVSFPAG
uniref:Uncharacterized protein n=1 Tax=Rangifer tarandus platyrhynchus TaxID=3082113 RepID=A0ACB0FBJ9_RANTA|nr:unnamed protein product [Rangifer tarandus platyrhynchus]